MDLFDEHLKYEGPFWKFMIRITEKLGDYKRINKTKLQLRRERK